MKPTFRELFYGLPNTPLDDYLRTRVRKSIKKECGVTKQTVFNWLGEYTTPSIEKQQKIVAILKRFIPEVEEVAFPINQERKDAA